MNARQVMRTLKKKARAYLREIKNRKTSEHAIALGFAVGTFIGIIPTPGFGVFLGFASILLIKNMNKVSVFFGLAFWNYLTLTPIYLLSFKIGNLLFDEAPVVRYKFQILNQLYSFSRRFLVGNFILAVVISIACYFLVKALVRTYRRRTRDRLSDRHQAFLSTTKKPDAQS